MRRCARISDGRLIWRAVRGVPPLCTRGPATGAQSAVRVKAASPHRILPQLSCREYTSCPTKICRCDAPRAQSPQAVPVLSGCQGQSGCLELPYCCWLAGAQPKGQDGSGSQAWHCTPRRVSLLVDCTTVCQQLPSCRAASNPKPLFDHTVA